MPHQRPKVYIQVHTVSTEPQLPLGNASGDQPSIKAFVVLAPADRSRQDLYRTVTADAQGTFRISAIAPGAYSLLALERNEDDDYLDPELFRSWESSTVALKLDPGSSKTAELKLVRIR